MFHAFPMKHLTNMNDSPQAVQGSEANWVYLLNISKQER